MMGGGALFKNIYKCRFFLLMMFQTLTGQYLSDDSNTRGGLHSVVSHKSFFGNQEIRQLEL